MTQNTYRTLTSEEIKQLENQGCTAEDWQYITVGSGFDALYLRDVRFSGHIRIGATGTPIVSEDGIPRRSGLYNATLHDVTLGDRCYIRNIGSHIARYRIGNDVYIENSGRIECTMSPAFGIGTPVATVNEGGGREVPLSPSLNAQIAYLTAMYRHRPQTVERLSQMLANVRPANAKGTIGDRTRIVACKTIVDVDITGIGALIEGASALRDGTIVSTAEDPATIGHGASATSFVMAPGSRLGTGTITHRCFIGEAAHLDNGFSAENSLFFANCEFSNGEACSIFAGPYTVSHHKASLLIAGIFSFFNAGSGANQSNHLYKTGAVHQGVHERGCKLASNAYIMLPARTGAFTVVIGRHTSHHDTAQFPFSYLIEQEGKSYLMPGINLKSYGTLRDMEKWPRRDRRKATGQDKIIFDQLNPYLLNKILQAIDTTETLTAQSGVDTHTVGRAKIKDVLLRKGLRLYRLALSAAIGRLLTIDSPTDQTETCPAAESAPSLPVPHPSATDAFPAHPADTKDEQAQLPYGCGEWVDLAGLVAPRELVEELLDRIDRHEIETTDQLNAVLDGLYDNYPIYARNWAEKTLSRQLGHTPSQAEIAAAIAQGQTDGAKLDALIREDGASDSNAVMATGYGIDAMTAEERAEDFRQVRNL